ncbi:MAG: hypothetical protein ACUZ8O_11725 [Candidatus Anammoxibacter sp.]
MKNVLISSICIAMLCFMLSSCAINNGKGYPRSSWMNRLKVRNETDDLAKVEIETDSGETVAELTIKARKYKWCRLPNGTFIEFARFGDNEESYEYGKGKGFTINAKEGEFHRAILTLRGVVDEPYSAPPVPANDD